MVAFLYVLTLLLIKKLWDLPTADIVFPIFIQNFPKCGSWIWFYGFFRVYLR